MRVFNFKKRDDQDEGENDDDGGRGDNDNDTGRPGTQRKMTH